jgi:hypothetical protein
VPNRTSNMTSSGASIRRSEWPMPGCCASHRVLFATAPEEVAPASPGSLRRGGRGPGSSHSAAGVAVAAA